MSPSYLPPDSRIVDVSELRAVQDMGGEVMKKMSALLCALPEEDWRLDINTISTQQAALLSALFSPYLTLKDALALIESRPYEGWANIDAFLAEPQMAVIDTTTIDKAKGYLDVVSRYYELDALVTVEKARVRIRSLLYSPDRKNIWVVRRRFGGMRERISDRPDQ
jgi:general secretion pathway protein K